MTYKEALTKTMTTLSYKDTGIFFIGYNTAYGHRFNGTLTGTRTGSCIEMPVAENLIVGIAIGLALEGFRPVICLERMDFLWACADAIVNHLDKAKQLGWPPLRVIIRTCVGARTPLDPGIQHSGDYVNTFSSLLSAPVVAIKRAEDVATAYEVAYKHKGPIIVVEYRKMYSEPIRPTAISKPKKNNISKG